MAGETLNRLYEMQPSAQQAIATSAGYAVFSNFGMKILFMGGGHNPLTIDVFILKK